MLKITIMDKQITVNCSKYRSSDIIENFTHKFDHEPGDWFITLTKASITKTWTRIPIPQDIEVTRFVDNSNKWVKAGTIPQGDFTVDELITEIGKICLAYFADKPNFPQEYPHILRSDAKFIYFAGKDKNNRPIYMRFPELLCDIFGLDYHQLTEMPNTPNTQTDPYRQPSINRNLKNIFIYGNGLQLGMVTVPNESIFGDVITEEFRPNYINMGNLKELVIELFSKEKLYIPFNYGDVYLTFLMRRTVPLEKLPEGEIKASNKPEPHPLEEFEGEEYVEEIM